MISAAESSYIIRPSWYLVLFVVLTMLLYAPTFMEPRFLWAGNEDYNHGFLIILVSAYLVWRGGGSSCGCCSIQARWESCFALGRFLSAGDGRNRY